MAGKLLVVSGISGSGKDTVIEEILKKTSFERLVTCADRPARPGEIHEVHYYFVSTAELDRMHTKGELVEAPLSYGTSRKATPKKEFRKVVHKNKNLIWRIESSLAAHVASGKFFDEQFDPEEREILKKSTTVIFITAKKDDIINRRKSRDGAKYDPEEFVVRDKQDAEILRKYGHLFPNLIENKEGQLEKTVGRILDLLAP